MFYCTIWGHSTFLHVRKTCTLHEMLGHSLDQTNLWTGYLDWTAIRFSSIASVTGSWEAKAWTRVSLWELAWTVYLLSLISSWDGLDLVRSMLTNIFSFLGLGYPRTPHCTIAPCRTFYRALYRSSYAPVASSTYHRIYKKYPAVSFFMPTMCTTPSTFYKVPVVSSLFWDRMYIYNA